MRWDRGGRDGIGQEGWRRRGWVRSDAGGMGWDGMGWDGTGWDGIGVGKDATVNGMGRLRVWGGNEVAYVEGEQGKGWGGMQVGRGRVAGDGMGWNGVEWDENR